MSSLMGRLADSKQGKAATDVRVLLARYYAEIGCFLSVEWRVRRDRDL
jgi:hypothetical protein